jgi:hypothetical protein
MFSGEHLWPMTASIAILVTLTVALFWEGRRLSPPPAHPGSAWGAAVGAGAGFAALMYPLWKVAPGTTILLFGSLAAFGWFLLKFGTRRTRERS